MKTDMQKLAMWQHRLADNRSKYAVEEAKMDTREALYRGIDTVTPMVPGDKTTKAPHVRNICAEMIESLVSSTIPMPKVTARRKKDERLAKVIEDMLRNEINRMPFEQLNDMMERTVPIQGGAAFLVEWDNNQRTHYTVGELTVQTVHPKQIVPQDGVYTGIEDMDYIILKVPQTKEYINARYGVDVSDQSEEFPEAKGIVEGTATDMVTQNIAYYRNDKGGIGVYSWVNNTQIEDLEDYQARHLKKCAVCGASENDALEPLSEATVDGTPAGVPGKRKRGVCPHCGSKRWVDGAEDYEEVYEPIRRTDGSYIPGAQYAMEPDELGNMVAVEQPTKVPYYKPDIYPVILCKNVSVFGQFLGDSDIDKLESYQNATNRIEAKIADKLLKAGSYITLPPDASIKFDAQDMKVIRPQSAADKAMIDVYDLQGDISPDLAYLSQVYEEAKQVIGVTDSYLGRSDPTATSGKAKEFAAAQSAGRMESKRVMKEAAYAALYEAMFKFKLAYADEPRPVVAKDNRGNKAYEEFNRYDFLEQDDAGEWCWNDQFLFSCDTASALANNREALWQETRNNLQTGAFGNPAEIDTLILFWQKMALLHYPGAEDTKDFMEQKQMQQMQMQQMMQRQQQMAQLRTTAGGMDSGTVNSVLEQAKRDAQADAMGMQGNNALSQ